MTEAAKNKAREYKRAWNRANRDKVRAAQERYWEKKAREAQAAAADPGQTDEPGQEA